MSLRTRVALASAAGALVVLVVSGVVLGVLLARDQYGDVDRQVAAVAQVVTPVLVREASARRPATDSSARERLAAQVADAVGTSYAAVAVRGDTVVATSGSSSGVPAELLTGHPLGFTTVRTTEGEYRVRTAMAGRRNLTVAVALPLGPAQARVTTVRRSVLLVGSVAVLLAAALGWLLAGPAVRPLRRLRERALTTGRTSRQAAQPWRSGGREVDEVAQALDALDDDLARSREREAQTLEAARGFAANAGHELRTLLTALSTDLAVLQSHPDLSPAERAEVLASLVRAEHRLRSTLQALEQLARGDLVRPGAMTDVDLTDLVLQVVDEAARHHPGTAVVADVPAGVERLRIWEPGIRLSLDNLITNAVQHGAARRVDVRVRAGDGGCELIVDDDGPGIAPGERAHVVGRFARGTGAVGSGSGLGLALVEQQVRLHGGRLGLGESPAGGLRVVLDLRSPSMGGVGTQQT